MNMAVDQALARCNSTFSRLPKSVMPYQIMTLHSSDEGSPCLLLYSYRSSCVALRFAPVIVPLYHNGARNC